ncbi:MAG: hypothetical protein ACHQ52_11605 [Candidatus Eisenbacteria bacterium]
MIRIGVLRTQPWVTVDGTEYIRLAEAFARGEGFRSVFPPGYPLLVALARVFVADRVRAAALVSLIAGSLLPLPVWTLARRALSWRWALVPLAVAVLHPTLVGLSTVTMSDATYITALYAGLALAARARPITSGLAMGFAYATRPEGLLPAAALVGAGMRSPGGRRVAALVLAGVLALAIPCWLYFHATWGGWTVSPKLGVFPAPARSWQAQEAMLRATPIGADSTEGVMPRAGEAFANAPRTALVQGRSLLALWPLPLLALSLWGLTRRRGLESIPLLHLLAVPFLGLPGQLRFVASVIPSLAIAATAGPALVRSRSLRVAAAVLGGAGVVMCAVPLWPDVLLPFDAHEQAQQEAGEWLAGVSDPGDLVMDRKPYVAFYADRPYRVMPAGSYEDIVGAAERSRVRWLVLDEGVVRVFRPQLQPLLYDRAFRERESRLEGVYLGGRFRGYGIAVFRVLRPGEQKSGRAPVVNVHWLDTPASRPGLPPVRP